MKRLIPARSYNPGLHAVDIDLPLRVRTIHVSFGREGWPSSGDVLSTSFTWPNGERVKAVLGPGRPERGSFVSLAVPTISENNLPVHRDLDAQRIALRIEFHQPVSTSISVEVN